MNWANVRIAVHAFDGMTMFHLSAPLLVFGEVGRLGLAAGWETTVWTSGARPIRTAEGMTIGAVSGPDAMADADLLVFPSWPSSLPVAEEVLTDDIRRAHARGAQVAGLCLGAFPVVDSDLLDGRVAVTHWAAAAQASPLTRPLCTAITETCSPPQGPPPRSMPAST